MEAFIFLFCWSANKLKGKGKSKARKADLEEEKSFYTRPHGEAYFTLWSGTTACPRLLFIAFISEDMEDRSYVASHVCLAAFCERKTLFILDVIYRCTFPPVSFVKKAHV